MKKQTKTKVKKMPPHWYRTYWGFCPVCGKPTQWRVRQYGPRTKKYVRISTLESYCGCLGW